MTTYDFPRDLHAAQMRLHQLRAEQYALGRALPWSVEPADGWTAPKTVQGGEPRSLPASPGYTEAQTGEIARLRGEVLALAVTVTTHPYWGTCSEGLVDLRTALKHFHGPACEYDEAA
ncbi:hypothetical protein [Streptomyces sp. H27-C3]|uniref:hypothetical protein n=1 Tax=Streptomyces sp. H27-C3 TaxID=3046305 RepID=UPI0024B9DB54|nr:hypothetical protein [Streptomyces sp. H27-C3]MDJ0466953.1 hypothetical protein [Streptomyces sp. H27-C3]